MGKKTYLWFVSIVAAFGGLLFGYDAVVVSGTNSQVEAQFAFTPGQLGFYVSCVLWGCMLGSGLAGWVSDVIGRKRTLLAAALMIFISAFWSATAGSITGLITARLVGGIGIGAATMVCPLYISEISPEEYRGRMVTLFQLTITIGIVMCVFANWGIFTFASGRGAGSGMNGLMAEGLGQKLVKENWRLMFFAESLPALLFLSAALFIPESPRWLVKQGKSDTALPILEKVNPKDRAAGIRDEIQEALKHESNLNFTDLFTRKLRRPLILALLVCFFAEACGVAVVFYYGPQIFEDAGFTLGSSLGGFATIAIVNFIATLFALRFVDSAGRKKLLLTGITGSFAAQVLIGSLFLGGQTGWPIVIAINLFVAFFASAIGPVKFVLISEIFPMQVRGKAIALSTVMIWATSATVAQLFPVMRAGMQTGFIFLIFAAVLLLYFMVVKAMMPETRGRTIEEIEQSWLRDN